MNLQELLQFAIESTESGEARYVAAYNEMDEKYRNFIASVLKFMTLDVMREFKEAIKALEDPVATLNEKINAFSVIKVEMENDGLPSDFAEVGGTALIVAYLSHWDMKLKYVLLKCIYEMLNNDNCKDRFIEANILPLIVQNFTHIEFEVGKTAMQAASLLVAHNDILVNKFIDAGGVTVLTNILNFAHRRLSYTACSLIALFSKKSDVLRDQLVIGLDPNRLIYRFEDACGFDADLESLLSALSELTRSNLWNLGSSINKQFMEIVQEIQCLCNAIPGMKKSLDSVGTIIQNLTTLN